MHVTIRSTNSIQGTILNANRVGIGCNLLIVESDRLNYTIPFKPGSIELEVRIPEQAVLASWGSFRIQLPADSTLYIQTVEGQVRISSDGKGSLDVLGVMVWIEQASTE